MKLFKNIAILGLGQAMPTSSGSSGLCEANSEAGCVGTFCSWDGFNCSVSGFRDTGAVQARIDAVSHISGRRDAVF